jgi:hypothetical protein
LSLVHSCIQDTVAPVLEQQVSWIRSRATIVGRSSVSIGTARYYKGKAIGNSELLVGSGRSQLVSLGAQGVSVHASAIVFAVIVICVVINLLSELIRYPIRTHVELLVTIPHTDPVYVTISTPCISHQFCPSVPSVISGFRLPS